MDLIDIQTLYKFNYWANGRLLDIIEPLSPELYFRDLHSSHGGIHGTLVHMMGAEEIWLKRWKGEATQGLRKVEEFTSFESLTNQWDMIQMEVEGFCHMLKTDDDVHRPLTYKNFKGDSYTQPLYQSMQHLVNHSSYHRGQIVTMLRQLGIKPVATDLIAFYRL